MTKLGPSQTQLNEVEDLQVLKYEPGGEYALHHDGYRRLATMIYYLNGVAGTWFPFAGLETLDDGSDDAATSRLEQAMSESEQVGAQSQPSLPIPGEWTPGNDRLRVIENEKCW